MIRRKMGRIKNKPKTNEEENTSVKRLMLISILELLKGKNQPISKNHIANTLWQEGIFGGLTSEPNSLQRVLAYLREHGYVDRAKYDPVHYDAGRTPEEGFEITLKGLWKLKSLKRGRLG